MGTALSLILLLTLLLRRAPSFGRLALAVILAGAVGNLLDRSLHGYVVDFIHLHHWPVFNVADICVTLGVLALLYHQLRQRSGRADPQPADK